MQKVTADMRTIFSVLILLLPFSTQFALPVAVPFVTDNLPLGVLVLLPFMLYFLFNKVPVGGIGDVRFRLYGGYFVFAAIVLAAGFLSAKPAGAGLSPMKSVLLTLAFFGLLVFSARGEFRFRYSMRAMSTLAFLCSVYVILQYIIFRVKGIVLPDGIRDSWVFGGAASDYLAAYGRPTGVFLTPDRFAWFVIPPMAYLLLWNRRGYHYAPFLASAVMTVALFMSRSALGFMMAAIIWGFYLAVPFLYFIIHPTDGVYRFLKQGIGPILCQIFVFMSAVILTTLYALDGTIATAVIPRAKALLTSPAVTSGLDLFSSVLTSTRAKFCGVGFGNIDAALTAAGIDPATVSLNTFGTAILSCGIAGAVALLALCAVLVLGRRGKMGICLAVLALVLVVFADVFCMPLFFYFFFIANSANDAEMTMRQYLRMP